MTETTHITEQFSGITPSHRCIQPSWRMHMSALSRRSLVASAAALPALAVPAVAVALPTSRVTDLADRICAEYDRIGENYDYALFDSLYDELWKTPATSISDLAAKARVLDKVFRINGETHTVTTDEWRLVDEILALEGIPIARLTPSASSA